MLPQALKRHGQKHGPSPPPPPPPHPGLFLDQEQIRPRVFGLLEVLGKKLYSVLASELRMADITRSATVTPLNISSPTGIP